jgi:hypothetical protein
MQVARDTTVRLWRILLILVAVTAVLGLAVGGYDALGYRQAVRFESEHADEPAAVLQSWQEFCAWHPTRNVIWPGAAQAEEEHLATLGEHVRKVRYAQDLAALRQQAGDPDADPEAAWQRYGEFRAAHAEAAPGPEVASVRAALKARRDQEVERRAEQAYAQLVRAGNEGVDLSVLLAQADQYLRDYHETEREPEVRKLRAAYLLRLDERDIDAARSYSATRPLNFQTRQERYQQYLDKHPLGTFAKEATDALKAIDTQWDRNDFRAVRDHFTARPGDVAELVARCRSYLAAHPQGRFTAAAAELLRWSERVTAPGEYRVILRSGDFEHSIARWLSRGPDLSVELEVAGIRYGPSTIVRNRYDPDWDYEFPRRIRWKLGDAVRIRVTDHDYWPRVVLDIQSDQSDPLAFRFLCGDTWAGANHLTFSSDFSMPVLPTVE